MTLTRSATLCRARAPAKPPVRVAGLLERCLARHPVVTFALALLLTGSAMLLAVGLATFLCILPLGLLLGWY